MTSDPKTAGPTPPQPRQQQDPPGFTEQLDPKPDHGEHSYRGCGKLKGRAALITGADTTRMSPIAWHGKQWRKLSTGRDNKTAYSRSRSIATSGSSAGGIG